MFHSSSSSSDSAPPSSVASRRAAAPATSPGAKARGLFSIPELRNPSDFVRSASDAMRRCDELRSSLSASRSSNLSSRKEARDVLFRLDGISRVVCNVIDAAELARSVCESEKWRDAAHRAPSVLADYISQLNGDRVLYESLLAVDDWYGTTSAEDSGLTEEEVRFVKLLRAEFERDGIHLPENERENVRKLQNQVTELESLFNSNLVNASNGSRKKFWADASAVLDVLPSHVLQAYGIDTDATVDSDEDGGKQQVQLSSGDVPILQSLLKYSADPGLRKQVHYECNTSVPENLEVLDALVARRRELAVALGYESYAQRFLADKMAGNQGEYSTRAVELASDVMSQISHTS